MTSGRKGRRVGRHKTARVFISHATEDRKRAERLARYLRRHHIDYWFSRQHLTEGHRWYREIGNGLQTCNWLVVLSTKAAIKSQWVQDEVMYALNDRRYRNQVVPLIFDGGDLKQISWPLMSVQYVDFSKGWKPALTRLLRLLKPTPAKRQRKR